MALVAPNGLVSRLGVEFDFSRGQAAVDVLLAASSLGLCQPVAILGGLFFAIGWSGNAN